MCELAALGTEHTKKAYLRQGVKEPLFGVATGAMKPLAKRVKRDHSLAMALYDTGIYDAMYFAGMIADPAVMAEADFDHWMQSAYCYVISDYVVAVSLAEMDFAQHVADRWIDSETELYMSAGWSCYIWLLGVKPDSDFEKAKLESMLERVEQEVYSAPNRVRYAMNGFVIAVGMSYQPLLERALKTAQQIGAIQAEGNEKTIKFPCAYDSIQKMVQSGRVGFKRRSVRC